MNAGVISQIKGTGQRYGENFLKYGNGSGQQTPHSNVIQGFITSSAVHRCYL
jgi:hypothetical protein